MLANWRRAITEPVKIETLPEWQALDWLTRWLIATRASISALTFYSCAIGGLLAWEALAEAGAGWHFPLLAWLVTTLGLFVAHGASNLINDYVDYSRGVDSDNYFRTHYITHPLIQKFMTKRQHALWFWATSAVAVLCGLYSWHHADYNSDLLWLFAIGAVILLTYTWPIKHMGLDGLSIFLVWGPFIITAVYIVLAGSWSWLVVVAACPFGLSVGLANNAEHIDKLDSDRAKGVHTLPVLLGDAAARWVTIACVVLCYAITMWLIFGPRYFTPAMLVVFAALRSAVPTVQHLMRPKPQEVPRDHPAWPMWFFSDTLRHSAMFGNWFVIGLVLEVVLRIAAPGFWH